MKINIDALGDNIATKITSETLNGVIYQFKRENLEVLSDINAISQTPMCYILYNDYFDRSINKNKVYIGQTDTGMVRIKSHHREKENWNKGLLIFYGKPSYDVIFRLESDLIQLSKKSLKYHVSNVKNENRGHVCDCQEEQYETFLKNLQLVLSTINIDVFERNSDGAFIYKEYPNLKALLTKRSQPYEIKILAGSYAEKDRLGFTKSLFEKYGVKTEFREKITCYERKGVLKENRKDVEYFYFNDDMCLSINNDEKMALYRFENVNGLSMHSFLE
ncbi:hypothetical protein HZM05_002846 [Salmonella enterica]|nr:hypothetical protein [Salmonella enterica]